jgi:hypothetical protein
MFGEEGTKLGNAGRRKHSCAPAPPIDERPPFSANDRPVKLDQNRAGWLSILVVVHPRGSTRFFAR